MQTDTKESPIVVKTQDLCQTLVEQPEFQDIKTKVDAFMADEMLKFQFQQVNDLGSLLQMKQSEGLALKDDEISQFEKMREELLSNPVAQGFIEAREKMQRVHSTVGTYLEKTFELGRRPDFEDVYTGCPDCNCHG